MTLLYLVVWGAEKIVYFMDVPFELFNLFAYV